MTTEEVFEKLFNGGNFGLPYLIKFSHPDLEAIRLVNNNENILFNGEVYAASSFTYTPPSNNGTGAHLSISSLPDEDNLFNFIESADYRYNMQVVGVLVEDSIQPLRVYHHFNGTLSMDEKGAIDFSLDGDDRLEMTFPNYSYDTDNNRGNA